MKIAFFEIRDQEKDFFEKELPGQDLYFSDQALLPSTILSELKDVEVISTHTSSKLNKDLINSFPNLKLIATRTTGFDHIDLEATKSKNIIVCNVPFYGENTVAEFAFALILSLSRKIPQSIAVVKFTHKFDFTNLQGFDIKGKTIGVIGTGHIGANVIKMSKGFEMNVIAFDAFPNNELAKQLQYTYNSLEDLLSKSDIITIHVPYIPPTHHLLNLQNLKDIKIGSIIINTARGEVIETKALYEGLKSGRIAAAGLDVLEEEGYFNINSKTQPENEISKMNLELISMDNVFITPHTAFNTIDAEQRIIKTTIDNIQSFIKNKPQNLVGNK